MKMIGLMVAFSAVALLDVPSLLKQKDDKVKYMVIYCFLFSIGLIVSLLQMMKRIPPSPTKVIESLIKNLL